MSAASDYDDGIKDCREGNPANMSRSPHYLMGYNYQYHMEQVRTEISLFNERMMERVRDENV